MDTMLTERSCEPEDRAGAAPASPGFIHLRVRSAYSLSVGALRTKELVGLAKKFRMPAVAVTDIANLFGALEFSLAAQEAGIQPIIGCELPVRRLQNRDGQGRPAVGPADPDKVVLLVQSDTGYANLLRLVSRAYLGTEDGEAPQVALSELLASSEGLLLLTGGPSGPMSRQLAEHRPEAARDLLRQLSRAFDGRLYVELMRHGLGAEEAVESALVDLAYELDLPLVATNDCLFAAPEFFEAHDVLLGIGDGTTMSNPNRRRLNAEFAFKPASEMRQLFADLPEACDNTVTIARRCAFLLQTRKPMLPPFASDSGRSEPEELRVRAHEGLALRLAGRADLDQDSRDAYAARVDYELGVIAQMGFSGYFLIVAEFIQWAKANGIPVGPGRGSGAGSAVAWSLTITDLDPLRFGLIFERFLNPERVSMPDFDVDFCQDRREEVIRHVQERYGFDRVAQIITFGKLQARAVLRDVGRVLEMPYGQVDRICKMVPNNPAKPVTLKQAVDGDLQLQAMRDADEAVGRLISIGLKLEGLYRNASTHAAGVVIGGRPLQELVPLYRDPRSDMPVTQFNMKYVEQAGLVKFDFLGLKTLTVIARAVDLIRARGTAIDIAEIPLDDRATFDLFVRAETVGVFQFEGAGMREMLRRMKPDRFGDLVAGVSLYRPGPMDDIPRYIACKHGVEPADYLHPTLEPVLNETYGVIVYQEQAMQIAQLLAGYSLGAADLLRRAMGKKIKSEMDAQREVFLAGAKERGVRPETASGIFDKVAKFAGYGFNKCHAAPYAMVSYQTGYLKANYPVEFMAASMTLELGNTDKLNVFRQELVRMGIRLLPPDVNRSGVTFTVEPAAADLKPGETPSIRYGLAAVKGVGPQAMEAVVAERTASGPFRSLFDLAQRVEARSLTKRQLEMLAKAGALDSLNPNRAQTLAAADLVLRYGAAAAEERASAQIGLFGQIQSASPRPPLPELADWPAAEKLQNEFDAIGFYLSAHPIDAYGRTLEQLGVVRSADILARLQQPGGGSTRFKLAGIVVSRKERNSAKGSRFAFVQMSDASGMFEVMLFSEILAQTRELLEAGQPLLISADARADGETVRLTAQSIESLDKAAANAATGIKVFVSTEAAVHRLKTAIEQEGSGRGRVKIVVSDRARQIEIGLPGLYRLSPALRGSVKQLPGIDDVHEI